MVISRNRLKESFHPAVKSVFDKFPGRLASALRATWGQLFEAFSQGSSGMLDGRYFQNPLNPKNHWFWVNSG